MIYNVKQYIPLPLRCFECQKFGHVAAICKGKQWCGSCAGEHKYGKCEREAKIKCCICGGEHTAAYHRCQVSQRAQEIHKMKPAQGITQAEAAKKKIPNQSGIPNPTVPPNVRPKACNGCSKIAK